MNSFKVGDWVRIWGKPTRILRVGGTEEEPEYYDYVVGYRNGCLNPNGLEPWYPRENEYCWFHDGYGNRIMAGFVRITKKGKYVSNDDILIYNKDAVVQYNNKWKYCEPYLGELPSFMKDNK